LKPASGAARAGIVAAKLLHKLLLAMDDSESALHLGFGRESFAALTAALVERKIGEGSFRSTWHPPCVDWIEQLTTSQL
jgi:hypothetical protein